MPYDNDDQYSLVRTIRYNKKDNDNPFLIKYYGNMPLKFIVEDKKTGNNAQPSREKIQEKIQTPKAQKIAKQAKQGHYERKNQKYRQTQIKQIEELKKFAKVDIKKLKKQQRKEAQRQKKEQEKQAGKKEKQERFKPKKESKYQQITQPKEQKVQKKVQKKIQSVVPLNRIRSKSISQIQKHDFKKKDRCQFLTRPEPKKASSRRIYDQYLQIEEIEESRRKGEKKYYRGTVEFSDRIKWFGKIKTLQVDGTLVVQGKSRNRCIHEDQVYFEIVQETPLKTYCKVVAIIPPDVKRQIVGRIDFLQEKRLYYITPINKRFIAMNVRMNEIQRSWLKQINQKYFIVEFYNWERNSQYPQCTVIAEYGRFGEIEVQSNALLKTHNVYEKQYTETQIESGLGKFISQADVNGEYQISPQEITKRADLRKETIFTIDPLTARDFDDALSIRRLNDDDFDNLELDFSKIENEEIYEIGVHIADASFFVQENSIIDQEAKKRTTSVYLVHKVLPMLPRVLCETMCSLNPGLERLTLSVWFYIDIEGNILPGVRFDRTVIKSKARFTYQQAQHIIEGKITSQTDIPQGFGCIDPKDDRIIFNDIITMNTIAMALRKRRIQGGSLIFETPKKSFQLNEKHFPISYDIKNRCESNFLVEEYMLLANKKVGEILVDNIGSQALLRRHPFPGEKKISTFEAFMKKIGHPIKVQKSTKIQQQINKILADETIKMATKEIIKHEMIYLLETADYFVVGQTEEHQWLHYALNMPVYTHFTSPIRRYPDIIVHRQLISVIQANKKNTKAIPFNDDILKSLVERCNKNKTNAKKVSSDCEKLFLCLYLKDKPAFTQAILVGVEDWGFKISVPKYDCRVVLKLTDMKNIKVLKFEKTQDDRKYMHVQVSEEQVSMKLVLKELQQIHIRLGSTETFPLDYRINLVFPHPKKAGQKIIIK